MVRATAVTLALLGALGACGPAPGPSTPIRAATSAPALPPLEVTSLSGAPWSAARAAGKVVLIDVWASWCKPCRTGLRRADALAAADPDLVVLGLSIDEEDAAARGFLAAVPVKIATARVAASVLQAPPLAISSLPALIVVDGAGRIRWVREDAQEADYDVAAAVIAQLRAEAGGAPSS